MAQNALVPSPLVNGPATTILDSSAYTTSGSGAALIKPPKRSTRTVRVEINSIDRDYGKYPFSSNFRWVFPFPVKEVRQLSIIGGSIPIPYLNIDSGWNKFTLQENGVNYTVTIPVGFYNITTLISALITALNSCGASNTYTVTQVNGRGALQFTATAGGLNFAFLFSTGSYVDVMDYRTKALLEMNCPGRILGFGWADYYQASNSIISPRLPNLWFGLERSYLYLNFDSSIDLRGVLRGAGRNEPTAIFYNDELNAYNYPYPNTLPAFNLVPLTKYLNKETFDITINPAPAPLSRISYLEVSLRDEFYRLINTQGRELSLLLEMVIAD